MSEEGELQKQIKKYFEELVIPELSGGEADDLAEIVNEMKKEFPWILPKGCDNIQDTILYWERKIKIQKTSHENNRTLISWMESDLKKLKWFVRMFGE